MARTATTISWAGCGHGCGCIDITHSILRPETGNVDRSTILPSRAPTRSTGRTRPWRVRRVAELTSRIGKNFKRCGVGVVDWREVGWTWSWPRAAVPRRVRAVAPRGGPLPAAWADRHGGLGQPRHPHPKGSRLLRALLAELGEQLVLVYTRPT